jgi:serine/threonine protein kinase
MSEISPRSMQSVESTLSPPRAKFTHTVSFSNGKPSVVDKDTLSQSLAATLPTAVTREMEAAAEKETVTQHPHQHQQSSLSLNELTELSDYEEDKNDEDSLAESGSIAMPTSKHFSSLLPNSFNFESEDTHNPLTQLICSQSKKRVPNWDEVLLYMQSNLTQCKRLHGWDEELPLHWALRETAPLYIIEPLLKIFPEGSSCRGRHGAIPLWYALGTPREAEEMYTLVELLVNEYPHGVRLKVDKLLPLHMAVKVGISEKIIGLLLNLDLPYSDDGFPITYHAFSWAWVIENTGTKYINTIRDIILTHRSIAQELAKAQTDRGTIALQVGHNDVRQIVFNEAFFCGRYEIRMSHPIHKSNSVVVVHAIDHKADLSYSQAFDEQVVAMGKNEEDSGGDGDDAEIVEMDETHFVAALQRVGGFVDSDAQDLSRIFGGNDGTTATTGISKSVFVRYCKSIFNSPREVVIKFMKNEVSFMREYNSRTSCNLDCRYVVHILNTLSGSTLIEAIGRLQLAGVKSMEDFKYGIVMPVSERSLESICIHEDLDTIHICKIMKDLALALQHVHARGICHGDVRMRNVIRIAKRYCLVDLTASANLEIFYIQDADMFGSKFHTAILPPEMFVKVSPHGENCIGKYWANSRDFEEQWPHVKPVRTPLGTYSVRSYDLDLKTKRPRDLHLLPYSPMSASTSIDMWGFGLLLYNLCCGEPLLYSSRNDDIINPIDYAAAALWTEASLQKKIDANVLDPIAADLIMDLLQPNPEDRPASMKAVLEHVYFSALDDGARKSVNGQKMEEIFTAHALRTHEDVDTFNVNESQSPAPREKNRRSITPIKEVSGPIYEITSRSVMSEVKRSHHILRRFLFESGDTYFPTCFVVVNQKLSPSGKDDTNKMKTTNSIDSQSDDSSESEEKNQLVVHGSNPVFFRKNQSQVARRWYSYFYAIANAQRNNDKLSAEKMINEIKKMCMEEELYLYFVDEVTMQVIQPDKGSKKLDGTVYPIRITNGEELIPKIFPLMKVSLHAIAAFRDMEVMCRSFGFPANSLEDVDIHCVNSLGDISAASAEKDFDDITKIIAESGLLNVVASTSTPKKPGQHMSDASGPSTPSRGAGGDRDASLYKILASRVFTEDNMFTGTKNLSLKELGVFLAAHDAVGGYGGLQKVQIKDNVVTYTTKANMDKFMKSMADDKKGDDKKKANQKKRGSNDSVQSGSGTGAMLGLSSGAISVDDVNDNVMHLRDDVQRLQRVLERMNKREEARIAKEEEPFCTPMCGPNGCCGPNSSCCGPESCCTIS